MRILTINHHEPFLCSLAATGYEFDVITSMKGLNLSWSKTTRSQPDNINLLEFDEVIERRLKEGYYDYVVCHTMKNLIWFWKYTNVRFIFIAHIPLFFYSFSLAIKSSIKKLFYLAFKATHQCRFVAVSQFKQNQWFEKGEAIVLTPESMPALYPDASYDQITVVGNKLKQRSQELGLDLIDKLAGQFNLKAIGNNPELSYGFMPNSFEEFVHEVRKSRIYLYTIQQPFGDGYNTSMLEAMSMGKCIVTLPNPSSPIKHNQNGMIGHNYEELVSILRELLEHPEKVDALGREAQKTIQESFSKEQFVDRWKAVLKRDSADVCLA